MQYSLYVNQKRESEQKYLQPQWDQHFQEVVPSISLNFHHPLQDKNKTNKTTHKPNYKKKKKTHIN